MRLNVKNSQLSLEGAYVAQVCWLHGGVSDYLLRGQWFDPTFCHFKIKQFLPLHCLCLLEESLRAGVCGRKSKHSMQLVNA